jgi:hypothetical protein
MVGAKGAVTMRTLVILAVALFTGACATAPDFRAVDDPDQPIVRTGYSVLPPGGANWVLHTGTPPEIAVFGKADREHARQRGSLVLSTLGMRARKHAIETGEGLLAEVGDYVRGPGGSRISVVSERLELYRDDALATDCVRLAVAFEERDNPRMSGEVLTMPMWGKACRHPHVTGYFVMVTYSERRPATVAPLMTEALRAECEHTIASLRWLPVK